MHHVGGRKDMVDDNVVVDEVELDLATVACQFPFR